MTQYTEFFFLQQRLVASRTCWPIHTNQEKLFVSPSVALLCPVCGEVWGRRYIEQQRWVASAVPCSRHGGGSFLSDFEVQQLGASVGSSYGANDNYWPTALLTYEILQLK